MNPIESPQNRRNAEKKKLGLTGEDWTVSEFTLADYGRMADGFGLADTLKLSDKKDKQLIRYYFAQRMLRTAIYESSRTLSLPITLFTVNIPILGTMVRWLDRIDRKNRLILREIERRTQIFYAIRYGGTEEGQQHARTIELAVNELVAQATVDDRTKNTEVNITKSLVVQWGEKWLPKLH